MESHHLVVGEDQCLQGPPARHVEGVGDCVEPSAGGEGIRSGGRDPGGERPFGLDDPWRGEGTVEAGMSGLEKMAILAEPGHGIAYGGGGMASGCMAEGDGLQVCRRNHGDPCLEGFKRPPGDLQHGPVGPLWVEWAMVGRRSASQTETRRAFPPLALQVVEVAIGLAPSGDECCQRGRARCPRQPQAVEVFQDLAAAAGELIEERLVVPGNLETRHASDHRRHHDQAKVVKARCQDIAIEGADELPVAPQRCRIHRTPPRRGRAGHVGDHAVGMDLRIVVAAGDVTKGGGHQVIGPHPWPLACCAIEHSRLEKSFLDPAECRPRGMVMGVDHALVALEERFESHGLRRREDEIDTRPVPVLTLAYRSKPKTGSGHVPFEDRLEGFGIHRTCEAEGPGALPVPAACEAVFGIIIPHLPVPGIVAHGRGRGCQLGDARNHGPRSEMFLLCSVTS